MDLQLTGKKALSTGTMIEIDGGQQKPLMDPLRDR
jgi:hypothetical protein